MAHNLASKRWFVFALMLLMVQLRCLADVLRIVQPSTREILINGRSVTVDKGISLPIAISLYQILPPQAQKGAQPSIYHIPGFAAFYAVTASSRTEDGLALYVFEQKGETFREVFSGRGADDSYFLRPTFFAGRDRTLIMTETGDESGTWGLDAYEITSEKVAYVGNLDAARSNPEKADCWSNPIADAKVEFVKKTYIIQLRGEIYLHPGGTDQKKLSGLGWHTFVLEQAHFVPRP